MAHNINRHAITGQDAFFSVKEKAWHGLGQIVDNHPTSAEAIIHAGLNYQVERRPIYTATTLINTHFATIRTDTEQVLGVVGNKYQVVQNAEAFTFFDELVKDNGIQYETAGALGNGERIFITAKMPDHIKIGRKDLIEQYVFLTTSHDGSGSIIAAFTPIRIACNNTLSMAMNNHSSSVIIKHTANAVEKIREAARFMHIAETTAEQLEYIFNSWAKIRISDKELKNLVRLAMAPNKEVFHAVATNATAYEYSRQFDDVCGKVLEYAHAAESQQMETTAGTIFGAYNAITGYYQNVKQYSSGDAKLNNILFGTGLERSKKAFQLCEAAATSLS